MTNLLIKLFIPQDKLHTEGEKRLAYGSLAGFTGIACNVLLFIVKILVGIFTGAISVVADALNNLSDAASSIITLIGFHMAGKPADPNHPFGHGRIEYVTGLLVAGAILMMGLELLKSSVNQILHPTEPVIYPVAVILLLISIGVKLWMGLFYRKMGEMTGSETMKAASTDSFSDCVATTAVIASCLLYLIFHINVDGIIGCGVAIGVCIAGFETAKDTIQPLLGQAPDPQLVQNIADEVCSHKEILGLHDLIVHDYGLGRRIISLHAEVDYHGDIMVLHDTIDNIERNLKKKFQCEATIHMDPVVTDNEEINEMREKVEGIVHACNDQWHIHDFRMVSGPTHTNVIFDLVVPADQLSQKKEISKQVSELIEIMDKNTHAVITVEQSYSPVI